MPQVLWSYQVIGGIECRYLSICSSISVIPSKESNVYNYDL